jgi:3-methyladenine DNA glycosylase AlkD
MLEQVADPAHGQWAQENHPTAMQVLGVRSAELNEIVKQLARQLRQAPPDEVIELAQALAGCGILECYRVACQLLSGHKAALAALQVEEVEALGEGIDNWVAVDNFAVLVAGPAWREEQIPDDVVRGWARSEDRWWRRTAVVCTVALNQKARGGDGDAPRTLDICRRVVSDRDDMVVKALSWALRELAKRDPAPVVAFLEEHEELLPARVKREVRRKIETGRKNGLSRAVRQRSGGPGQGRSGL